MYYRICENCGAVLDVGERCDCAALPDPHQREPVMMPFERSKMFYPVIFNTDAEGSVNNNYKGA